MSFPTHEKIGDNVNDKTGAFNSKLLQLEAMMTEPYDIDVTSSNAYTLSNYEFYNYGVFRIDDAAGANDSINITVPNIPRPKFVIINNTAFDVFIKVLGQTPSRTISAGECGHYVFINGSVETSNGVEIGSVTPLEAWSWGANVSDGQLGLNDLTNRSSPVQIGSSTDWSMVESGYQHTLAVKTDGTLWSWGEANDQGQLGDGSIVDKSSPVQIGASIDWSKVSGGEDHSLAVKTDGTLWSWGQGADGRLGDGTTVDKSSPVQIGSSTDWAYISAGKSTSYSIKTDGTLWGWGNNGSAVGDGTVTDRSSPVQIGASTDWAQISGGNLFAMAVKTDGTLWGWGVASSGRLGNGTTTPNLSSPVQIGASTDWAQVSCSEAHSMAVKTDGTLWGWGDAVSGVLGKGDTVDVSSPVQIGALTDWLEVRTGPNHTVALKTDGTLWAWGLNSSGQLGDGTTTSKSSPVQIGALDTWSKITAGNNFTIALKEV